MLTVRAAGWDRAVIPTSPVSTTKSANASSDLLLAESGKISRHSCALRENPSARSTAYSIPPYRVDKRTICRTSIFFPPFRIIPRISFPSPRGACAECIHERERQLLFREVQSRRLSGDALPPGIVEQIVADLERQPDVLAVLPQAAVVFGVIRRAGSRRSRSTWRGGTPSCRR